ncbi:MAG: transcription antitermination factor NusB [Bilophila wadsworthia]
MKKKKQNDEAPLPAREAALRILERTGISAPVQSLLDTKLTGGLFSRQEAALTTELVYGHLRSEIRISWLLSQFMKAPEKLPASMKLMIGIAAYELLYLDRIPAHASVSASVDAVRARFGQGLSRVANGVLRSLIRLSESEDLKAFAFYESRIKDPMERLSVFHSVPRWMLELWTKGYGPEKAKTFARAVSVVPSPCVRVNAARDEWEALRDFLCKEGEAVGISESASRPAPSRSICGTTCGKQAVDTGRGSQLVLEALDAPRWKAPCGTPAPDAAARRSRSLSWACPSSPPAIRTSPGCGA